MARQYADQAAYEAYHGLSAGAAPANVDTLLRTASRAVDHLLRGIVYATDADGYPTDPDVTQALSDATCAIAGEVDATGVLDAGGSQEWASVGIGGVSLSGRQTAAGATTVAGIPVPGVALIHLADVGQVRVVVT